MMSLNTYSQDTFIQVFEDKLKYTLIVSVSGHNVSSQNKCTRYKAYGICQLCLAVAEIENILQEYCSYFKQ